MSTKFHGHVPGALMPSDDLYRNTRNLFKQAIFVVQRFIDEVSCVSLLEGGHF